MASKAKKVRLGIFILVSSVLLLILIGFFTAKRLFESTDTYYVGYENVSVSGLEVGTPVKYMGINVGTIADIFIDPDNVNRIIIELSLREGTPVKTDATADIVSMGITGLKTIEIRGGSNDAEFMEEGKFISQGTSLVEDISGRAEVIAFKVEEVLNNLIDFTQPENMNKVSSAIESVSEFSDNAISSFNLIDEVIQENRTQLQETVEQSNQITKSFEVTAKEFEQASTKFNSLMQSDTLGIVLGNLRDISATLKESNLSGLIENLAETTKQTQQILVRLDNDIEKGSENLTENLILLQNTLENLEEVSGKINANPSILIRGERSKGIPDRKLQ
ncbi:MAG: MlaD family protein [Bacteroidales bacterium]